MYFKLRYAEDQLKCDFHAEEPLTKCVTDMTEIKGCDGKLYVSAIFDCFDSSVIDLAMDTNMKASLCKETLENAAKAYPWSHYPFRQGKPVYQPALPGSGGLPPMIKRQQYYDSLKEAA